MTTRQAIDSIIEDFGEDRLRELLDFAQYIRLRDESGRWSQFGKQQLARGYGDDEPEYRLEDVELDPTA